MSHLPEPADFYANASLYERFNLRNEPSKHLESILDFKGPLEVFCVNCKRMSIFRNDEHLRPVIGIPPRKLQERLRSKIILEHDDCLHELQLDCMNNREHKLIFHLMIKDMVLMKMGQYPSQVDLSQPFKKKYEQYIKEHSIELRKAVECHAYGYHIGAYVYLRRIFEYLIELAHKEAIKDPNWQDSGYDPRQLRMKERIKKLSKYLPEKLVENAEYYSALSEGIHKLTEAKCATYFNAMKTGIEFILDDLSAKVEKKKKEKELDQAIREIKSGNN